MSWVANHRRHHMFSDQPGDPHSPHGSGGGGLRSDPRVRSCPRGLAVQSRRHIGPTLRARHAARPRRDRDQPALPPVRGGLPGDPLRQRLAPFRPGRWLARRPRCCGRVLCGWRCCITSRGASTRCATCSGDARSPTRTRAPTSRRWRSCRWGSRGTTPTTRFASARHGARRGQVDSSAALIRLFERARLGHQGAVAYRGAACGRRSDLTLRRVEYTECLHRSAVADRSSAVSPPGPREDSSRPALPAH